MNNEFILHIRFRPSHKQDVPMAEILSRKEYSATLISEIIIGNGKEALYRIRIKPASLIKLKKFLDDKMEYQSIELFEYRMW